MSDAPIHILLIEDNPEDACLLRELLSDADPGRFGLTHVDRLAHGITRIQEGGIDLVLLGLSLPDSQGLDTLLQMDTIAMGIPIVVLTAVEDETLGLKSVQHGAQDYLVKGQVAGSQLQRSLRYAVERARTTRELRERTSLLQSVLDSVADGVVMASETGEFKVWNPAAERIIGTGPANMATERWSAHFGLFLPDRVTPYPSEDLPLVRAIRGESVNEIVVCLKTPGSPKEAWLSVNARPLHDGTGHVKGGVAVFRDITEHTRTEQERQKLARDRLLLLDSTGDGMYGIDLEGRCTFINKAGAQMFGYLPHEVMGKDMHQLIHHSFPDGTPYPCKECHIYEVFRSGRGCQIDHEVFWRKDGTAFPVDYTSFPVYEQDTMTGAVVTFLDITTRRQLEDELTQRAARLVKQQSALTDLTQSRCFQRSALMPTLQRITEMAARTLAMERVGIWRYTDDRTAIQCMDLYELSHDRHAAEMTLPVHSFPGYFDALVKSRIIAADDAHTDDRTAGFSAEYLSKSGISSLMDVPIYLFGRLEGVICHEHVGPARRWTEDEEMFAAAVSNLVTLAYEQGERRRAEEQLEQSQERLRSLTARLESIQEEERIRIAREVHDELGQALTGVKLESRSLRDQLPDAGPAITRRVESISKLVDRTMQSVRKDRHGVTAGRVGPTRPDSRHRMAGPRISKQDEDPVHAEYFSPNRYAFHRPFDRRVPHFSGNSDECGPSCAGIPCGHQLA